MVLTFVNSSDWRLFSFPELGGVTVAYNGKGHCFAQLGKALVLTVEQFEEARSLYHDLDTCPSIESHTNVMWQVHVASHEGFP